MRLSSPLSVLWSLPLRQFTSMRLSSPLCVPWKLPDRHFTSLRLSSPLCRPRSLPMRQSASLRLSSPLSVPWRGRQLPPHRPAVAPVTSNYRTSSSAIPSLSNEPLPHTHTCTHTHSCTHPHTCSHEMYIRRLQYVFHIILLNVFFAFTYIRRIVCFEQPYNFTRI